MVRIVGWITSLGGVLRGRASGPGERGPAPRRPVLAIDDTTAHVVVAAGQAGELLAWFRGEGIACEILPCGAVCGSDRIDFGDPTPAQERRIRQAFAAWRGRNP
jgi:hypothetical protein